MFFKVVLPFLIFNFSPHLASAQCITTYVVRAGDTCISIAKNAFLSFPSFIALNKPINCLRMQVGQSLCLNKVGFTPFYAYKCLNIFQIPLTTTTDSCAAISAKTLINVDQLKKLNPGLDCDALQPGQEMCISLMPSLITTTQKIPLTTTKYMLITTLLSSTSQIISSRNYS